MDKAQENGGKRARICVDSASTWPPSGKAMRKTSHQHGEGTSREEDTHGLSWSLQRTWETQASLLRFQLISSKLYLAQRQWIRPSQHRKSWGQASTPSALQPGSPVARRTNATGQRSLASQLHAGSSTGWLWLQTRKSTVPREMEARPLPEQSRNSSHYMLLGLTFNSENKSKQTRRDLTEGGRMSFWKQVMTSLLTSVTLQYLHWNSSHPRDDQKSFKI